MAKVVWIDAFHLGLETTEEERKDLKKTLRDTYIIQSRKLETLKTLFGLGLTANAEAKSVNERVVVRDKRMKEMYNDIQRLDIEVDFLKKWYDSIKRKKNLKS